MKGIITAIVALALALVAAKGAYADDTEALCTATQELAQSIMTARQQNMPLDKIMKIAEGSEMTQLMVLEAYQSPAYRTEENRRQAAVEFGNEMGLLCYEGMRRRNAS